MDERGGLAGIITRDDPFNALIPWPASEEGHPFSLVEDRPGSIKELILFV